jgi:hypothetical protein
MRTTQILNIQFYEVFSGKQPRDMENFKEFSRRENIKTYIKHSNPM